MNGYSFGSTPTVGADRVGRHGAAGCASASTSRRKRKLLLDERAAVLLALTGELLQKGSLLRHRLEQRLKSAVLGAAICATEIIPARGAVWMAKHHLSHTEAAAL